MRVRPLLPLHPQIRGLPLLVMKRITGNTNLRAPRAHLHLPTYLNRHFRLRALPSTSTVHPRQRQATVSASYATRNVARRLCARTPASQLCQRRSNRVGYGRMRGGMNLQCLAHHRVWGYPVGPVRGECRRAAVRVRVYRSMRLVGSSFGQWFHLGCLRAIPVCVYLSRSVTCRLISTLMLCS